MKEIKVILGYVFCTLAVFSFIPIVYCNMNFGWFYPFRNSSMLIPMFFIIVGVILLMYDVHKIIKMMQENDEYYQKMKSGKENPDGVV